MLCLNLSCDESNTEPEIVSLKKGKHYKPRILGFGVGFQGCVSFPRGNSAHVFERGHDCFYCQFDVLWFDLQF